MTSQSKTNLVSGLIGFVAAAIVLYAATNAVPAISEFIHDHEPSNVTPIIVPGFRFLLVYDSENLAKLPAGQLEILTSGDVRDYAKAHCAKGEDGKTPEFRCFDQAADVSKESAVWQTAMGLPRQSSPWIVISNGKETYSGALPATVADTLAILKKYGGG